jgi:hypothetical protein
LFRLSQQGKGKQTQLDNIGSDTPYHHDVAELQKILQMCICVLIWIAIEWASLHHVDEAGLEFKIHVPNVDARSSSHIGGGRDRELAESLLK